MLAVVQAHPVALERVGGAAEPAAHLDERHLGAGVGAVQRRGDPGQAAADHDDAPSGAHVVLPARLRSATSAFCPPDSDIRSLSARCGSASICCSRR